MSICIALCAFNGENFLREQLKSVLEQNLKPDEVVVCDDGSSDGTLRLVSEFQKTKYFPVLIHKNEARLGVVGNYSRALGLCRGDYVALCDQDDIWLPQKLALSLKAIHKAEQEHGKNIPILVHSDLKVISSSGKLLASSFMQQQHLKHIDFQPLWTLLVQNFVTGCTVLVNRPLLEEALPIPPAAVMHDWWLALIAAARGKIVFIPEHTVLYRQHGSNVVGAKRFYSSKNLVKLFRLEEIEKGMARAFSQGFALQERLEALGQRDKDLDGVLLGIASGGAKALKAVLGKKVAKQGWLRNLMFYSLLVKSGYKRFLNERN